MNEVQQVINFLLQAVEAKNNTITNLTKQVEDLKKQIVTAATIVPETTNA